MFRAPTQTPPIGVLIDALPTTDQRAVAAHLGITARTLALWVRSGNAPRLAHLALFWETPWGISTADCEAYNGRQVALAWAHALERENANLRTRIRFLEETGDFGSANSPLWRVG